MDLARVRLETLWPGVENARAELINLSENHTFRLDLPKGERRALRVHRPGYQDRIAIESELDWVAALRQTGQIPVPKPIRGRNGAWVQELDPHDGAGPRHAVLFAFEAGHEPDEHFEGPPDLFFVLGRMAAICHAHARTWQRPPGFQRHAWTVQSMLSSNGIWGDWRQAPNVDRETGKVLEEAQQELSQRFERFGKTEDRFGLVHADMRLANLLVDGGDVRLLDFDDCGFGWFIYDFAAAISFYELSPKVRAWRESWCEGYEAIRTLPNDWRDMIDPAIVLRRMLLLAWIGSHAEAPLPQSLAPHFADGTRELAERFLAHEPIA